MRLALRRAVLLTVLASALCLPAFAVAEEGEGGEEARSEAPLDHGKLSVCDATPIDVGAVELTLAWTPTWTRPGPAGLDAPEHGDLQPLALGLAYGLAAEVDAVVTLSAASLEVRDPSGGVNAGSARGQGMGDASLALRWRYFSARGLDLAVVGGLTAPTGTPASATRPGLTQGYWSALASLVASADLGSFTANLEAGRVQPVSVGAGGARGAWFGGAGLGWQVAPWFQPTLEVTYQHALADGEPAARCLALTAGAVMPLSDALGVSLGVQRAVWGRNSVQHTAALVTVKTAF
jgi:hypothetical protein